MTSRSEAGFTLMEILVVLAIIGLALGLIAVRGSPGNRTLALEAAATGIAGDLRQARGQAVYGNIPVRLMIDLERRTWSLGNGPRHGLPPEVAVEFLTIASAVVGKGVAGVEFAPDGSSTGGTITLRDGARVVRITIDWLTGRVRIVHEA